MKHAAVPVAPPRVAFQGEPGAFSEAAARRALGETIDILPCRSFELMFDAVAAGAADMAVVPIENTLAGSVIPNFDLLEQHDDLAIFDEVVVRVVHNLIGAPGATLTGLRKVHSHPVALAQCETFLKAHPHLEVTPAYDTAGAVKMIMEGGRTDEAAIAGAGAAARYGGQILAAKIESNPQNFTRFFLVALRARAGTLRAQDTPDRPRKTSILFRVAHKPGALFRTLGAFADGGVDLTKIESRPIPGRPWEYSFYLDFVGDCEADPVQGV